MTTVEAGERRRVERAVPIAITVALGVAVAAALLTGTGTGPLANRVESFSVISGNWLQRVAGALPFGYAFGAGMIAAVNPCGFAMLPAYLGYYLGDDAGGSGTRVSGGLLRAAWVSVVVSSGFVLLFGVTGMIINFATTTIRNFTLSLFPWLGLLAGVLLVVAGGRMLRGGGVYSSLGDRVAARLGAGARQASARGYLAYGLAYAAASLGCTLPIFLIVVLGAASAEGFFYGASQFLLYALGMGFVITVLTLSTAFFKFTAFNKVRRAGRYTQPLSAVLLLLAGAYVVYYWLTLGGLLDRVV